MSDACAIQNRTDHPVLPKIPAMQAATTITVAVLFASFFMPPSLSCRLSTSDRCIQMFSPELNRKIQPPFGVCSCAEPEAVACRFIAAIFNLNPRFAQILDASVDSQDIRDAVVVGQR